MALRSYHSHDQNGPWPLKKNHMLLKLKCPARSPTLLFSTLAYKKALITDPSNQTLSLDPFEGIIFSDSG